jgi:putative adenylate-forming enzyme
MKFKFYILLYLIRLKLARLLFANNLSVLQKIRFLKLRKKLLNSAYYQLLAKDKMPLSRYPVIEKTEFMKNFDTINTAGIRYNEAIEIAIKAEHSRDFSPMLNEITIGLSTGTSGNRAVFLANEKERAMWVASMLDRVIGFSFRKRRVAFFLRANSNLYSSTQSKLLQFNFFDIYLDVDDHVRRLNQLQPHIITAQPSMLCLLAEKINEGSLKIKPEKVFSVAEVLTPEDKSFLQQSFGQLIHQVYQCTEGFMATSCKYGNLHFNEDFLMVEKKFVNEDETKFHPIITDLLRHTQPVIRYELNDIITPMKNCPCGSKMLAIESIEGRADDVIMLVNTLNKQVKLFPDIFRRTIVMADESITDYAVVQVGINHLELYVKSELENAYRKAYQAIEVMLLSYNIENVNVSRKYEDPTIRGNKKRRIRNEFKQTN